MNELLRETDDMASKRKACTEMKELLHRALESVNEVRATTSTGAPLRSNRLSVSASMASSTSTRAADAAGGGVALDDEDEMSSMHRVTVSRRNRQQYN